VLAKALRPPPDKHHGLTTSRPDTARAARPIAYEDARGCCGRARIIAGDRGYLDGEGFSRRDAVRQPL